MPGVNLRVKFGDGNAAPELEVRGSPARDLMARVWVKLDHERILPSSLCAIRTPQRRIYRMKLLEADGRPVSQARALELMSVLRNGLAA